MNWVLQGSGSRQTRVLRLMFSYHLVLVLRLQAIMPAGHVAGNPNFQSCSARPHSVARHPKREFFSAPTFPQANQAPHDESSSTIPSSSLRHSLVKSIACSCLSSLSVSQIRSHYRQPPPLAANRSHTYHVTVLVVPTTPSKHKHLHRRGLQNRANPAQRRPNAAGIP
jgi:hypothetical protein